MKLCNQTSDPNECRHFFQIQGWETYLIAPVVKNKKYSSKYRYRARQKKQNKKKNDFWRSVQKIGKVINCRPLLDSQ